MNTKPLRFSDTAPSLRKRADVMDETIHPQQPSSQSSSPNSDTLNPSILSALKHAAEQKLSVIFIARPRENPPADGGIMMIDLLDENPHPYVEAYLEMQKQ